MPEFRAKRHGKASKDIKKIPSSSADARRVAMRLEGLPPGDFDDLLWIMAQESVGVPGAHNGGSTASGLFQLLEAQRQAFYPHWRRLHWQSYRRGSRRHTLCHGSIWLGRSGSTFLGHAPLVLNRALQLVIFLIGANAAHAAPVDRDFSCYPAKGVAQHAVTAIRGGDPLTHLHNDDLLWAVSTNRMNVAGHFTLAEISCGAGCIRLASIDTRTGYVRWMPETVSNWPNGLAQPVDYRSDSRLIVVVGQLDEQGDLGPRYFLVDKQGFHTVGADRVCAKRGHRE